MESTESQRACLPPLKHFDFDKLKREEHEYQKRNTTMTPVSTASSASASPSYRYPTGPPPPYTHPTSHPISHPGPPPPQIRRSSGDDQEKQQTLPSIHEALGGEQPRTAYTSQPPYPAAPRSNYSTSAPSSPPAPRRAFAMDPPPPPPPLPYPARRSSGPQSHYHPDISPRTIQDHFGTSRPGYNGALPPPPPAQPTRNGYSPVHAGPAASYPHSYSAAPSSPVKTERAPAHSSAMPPPPPPPPATYSYAYPNYSHRPAFAGAHPPPPPASAVYQPSVTQPAPAHPPSSRPGAPDAEQNVYGESVKRHMDMYDFEAALNEIADGSSYMLDFSRHLGARMHQAQRTGPLPGTLPTVHEIDDLMAKSRGTLESLGRMRDIVVAQQAAYFQQAQEQQFKSQDEFKRDSIHDETKQGGFAGADAKKRRGRAAPPGRCHACQRAETPEWRRGPDGARTLCNACGLHYAKLTRKQGAQKAAGGDSNLRPKAGTSDQSDAQD